MKEQKKPFYCSNRLELYENERCITQCDHCAPKEKLLVQNLIDMMQEDEELGLYEETLEEAAYEYAEPYRCPVTNENEYCKHHIVSAFNNGAKWQQERSYSEEEVLEILYKHTEDLLAGKEITLEVWFEQFKKK